MALDKGLGLMAENLELYLSFISVVWGNYVVDQFACQRINEFSVGQHDSRRVETSTSNSLTQKMDHS